MESGSPSIEHEHRVKALFFFLPVTQNARKQKQQFSLVLERYSLTDNREYKEIKGHYAKDDVLCGINNRRRGN